jgi:hypothetical protein
MLFSPKEKGFKPVEQFNSSKQILVEFVAG